MKCSTCGKDVQEHEKYCQYCGDYIRKTEPQQQTYPKTQTQVRQPQTQTKKTTPVRAGEGGLFGKVFNFDNIGGKIKAWTKVSCYILIVLTWISCAIMSVVSLSSGNGVYFLLVWPLVALIAPIFIWVGSWGMYALGNFIENDDKKTKSQQIMAEAMQKQLLSDKNTNQD